MARVLVLLLVVGALVWWLARRSRPERGDASGAVPPSPEPSAVAHEAMVVCATCGVHLPRGEAVGGEAGGAVYCCAEHRPARPAP